MKKSIIQILKDNINDPYFEVPLANAIKVLDTAIIEKEGNLRLLIQSSKSVSELHAFRKRSGYYKRPPIGLDETIDMLANHDVPVRAGVLETDQGYIAIWVDEQNTLLGVMVC